MVRSPRSRGKGNRRWPGRPGGARKRKPQGGWRRRAQHLVGSIDELAGDVVTLTYWGAIHATPEQKIYVFDQQMARREIWYFAELHSLGRFTNFFTITVAAKDVGDVGDVVGRLRRF